MKRNGERHKNASHLKNAVNRYMVGANWLIERRKKIDLQIQGGKKEDRN
ncbi:hypothetical protein SSIL_1892 [Solibacillus silvestris StLB046]|uniref:Uncharacterized protein n=1 Tax=Solibacillus silvestris (strain StLB046) TaxID=1002809 RepID=F2F0S1_SOLSS|nr:hypothetical protein SSIL_1892 [Solibacillus silvestris StLB046]